jgi:uncharacterized delta-60 repeat protein
MLMPARQNQDSFSFSHFLVSFSRLIQWAANNPLQAVVAVLAFQSLMALAKETSKTENNHNEDSFSELELADRLKSHDISSHFQSHDLTKEFKQRSLQTSLDCDSGYVHLDGYALALGGAGDENGNAFAIGSDGKVVVAGSTSSFSGNSNVLLAQFFANGTLEWATSFGGSNTEEAEAVAILSDNSLVITGVTTSFGAGGEDLLLARFSSTGSLQWAKAFGTANYDRGKKLVINSLGKIQVIGYTDPSGSKDFLLAQFSTAGNLEWAYALGGSGADFGEAIALDSSGNILVTGSTYSYGAGGGDALLAKFSSSGSLQWAKAFGGSEFDSGFAIAIRNDGKILVTGSTDSYSGNGNANVFLLQFSASGALDWAKDFGGTAADAGNALTFKADGSLLLAGKSSFSNPNNQLLLAQFYGNGTLAWAKEFKEKSAGNYAKAVVINSDGLVMLAGDCPSGAGGGDVLLMQLNSNNQVPMLGENIYFSDISPTINSVSPSVASISPGLNALSLTTTTISTGQNTDVTSAIQKTPMNFMSNSWSGDELITPLNYAYYYKLYPNGPFQGMGQTPTISVDLTKAPWLNYDFINQVLYGTPLFDEQGSYFVQFSAAGSGTGNVGNLYGIVQMNICVKNYDYRVPSYFTDTLNPYRSASFNQLYQFNFSSLLKPGATVSSVTGRDGESLPSWLSYHAAQQQLQGTPSGSIRGNYLVDASFSYGSLGDTVTLVINVPNSAPQYTGPANNTVTIGRSTIDFSSRFIDTENDSVSYGLARINNQPAPSFISMDQQSGRMGINSISGDQGDYQINVTSTDSYNALGWSVIGIQIQNRDPERTQLLVPPSVTTVGFPFSYSFARDLYQDPDGDSVSYQTTYPSFLLYDASSRTFYGTPQATDRSLHNLTIIAKDAYNGMANVTVQLDINGIPSQQMVLSSLTTTAVGQAYSYTLPAELFTDPDGDALSYDLFEDVQHIIPGWLNFNSTTKTLYGTPTSNTHQAMPIRFQVSDNRGGAAIYDVSLNTPNSAPQVNAGVSDLLIPVGQVQSMVIPSSAFTDPDGDSLSYLLTQTNGASSPSWMSMATNIITFTPRSGAQGNYTMRVIAGDAYGASVNTTFIVTVPNQNPVKVESLAAASVVTVGNRFSYSFANSVFNDPDDDSLTYSVQAPGFLSFDPITRSLAGIPSVSDRGNQTVLFYATDPYGARANASIVINVNGIPSQQIALSSLTSTPVGTPYSFMLPAGLFIDPDGDIISYELNEDIQHIRPSWLSFNSTSQTLYGAPSSNTHQAMPIRFSVSDKRGGVAIYDVSLNTPNSAPQVSAGISDQVISVGQVKTVVIPATAFSDADSDSLSFRLEPVSSLSIPDWLSLAGNAMSFAPRSGAQGNYSIRLVANDGYGLEANATFAISVPNQNPVQAEALPAAPVVTTGNVFTYGFTNSVFKDQDGDALTYSAQAPGFLTFNANTRTLSGAPGIADRGSQQVTLFAADPFGGQANATIQIIINGIPSQQIALSSLTSSPVGTPYSFTLPAGLFIDPDGDIVSYELIEDIQHIKPSWLSFNSSARTLYGTPNSNTHQPMPIRLSVSDGRGAVAIYDVALNTPNSAPKMNVPLISQSILVGQAKTITVPNSAFVDFDGDSLSYRLEQADGNSLPDWIALAGNAMSFAPRTSSQGNYDLRLFANDGFGLEANSTFSLSVPNQSPIQVEPLSAAPVVTVGNAFSYSFSNTAFKDMDGDSLTYSAQAPGFLSFNPSTRTLSGMPRVSDRGNQTVLFFASDPYGAKANASLVVNVNGIPSQQISLSSLNTSPVGQAYSYILPNGLFADPDGDALTYDLIEDVQHIKPTWLSFNSSTRTLYGTPTSNIHQPMPIRFSVSDGRGGVMIYDVSLNTPNSAPMASSLANQSVSVNSVRSLLIPAGTFIDLDSDRLSYSLEPISVSSQSWISIANDVISFFPASGNQGSYDYKLIARDGYGGEASLNFSTMVPNSAPVQNYPIPLPPVAKAAEQWNFALDADNFEDADKDSLIYSASQANGETLPGWISFNPVRRSFAGMPRGSDRGTIPVVVEVNDGFGRSVRGYFNTSVINSAPVPDGRIFDQQVSQTESSFSFTVTSFSDPDADAVSYRAEMLDGSDLPSWVSFKQITRTFSVSPKEAAPGNYLMNIVATDSLGLSSKASFNLAIQAAPVIDLGTSSSEQVLQQVAPALGGAGILMLIAGLLMWRQRRIHSTNRGIQAWAHDKRQVARDIGNMQIEFAALSRELKLIGEMLTEGAELSAIATEVDSFEQRLKYYYAQGGKREPMTTLLDLHIVEKLIKFVERNVLEARGGNYDGLRTLGSARLLHAFLKIILSEHTGRGHLLLDEAKSIYFNRLNSLIDRLTVNGRVEVEIFYELHCAREILICIADTNTLWLLCLASASHILSPGSLLMDLKNLAFNIPSRWYVKLLEISSLAEKAKIDINALTRLQSIASSESDWHFKFGMISVLLDVIVHSQDPAIRNQAILGDQRHLGFIQLLDMNKGLCSSKSKWIAEQAKWALNQHSSRLEAADRQFLAKYLDAAPNSVNRRMTVMSMMASRVGLERKVANDWQQNPLYAKQTKTPAQSEGSLVVRSVFHPSQVAGWGGGSEPNPTH